MTSAQLTTDLIPPQEIDFEYAVIGACLLEGAVPPQVRARLTPTMFYREEFGRFYAHMLNLTKDGKPLDLSVMLAAFPDHRTAFAQSLDACAAKSNAPFYAEKVRQAAGRRYAINAIHEGALQLHDTETDPAVTISRIQGRLAKAALGLANGHRDIPVRVLMDRVHDYIEKATNGEVGDGVTVGIQVIDRITNGFAPGTVALLAARPGVGKTAFAMNAAIHAARTGKATVFFSHEMDPDVLMLRTVCGMSGVAFGSVRAGHISGDQCADLGRPMANLAELPLTIVDAADMNLQEMEVRLRKHKAQFGVIDYLQLVPPTVRNPRSREQEVAELSRGLHILARQLRIPLLVLTQLNRGAEMRDDREPDLHDLRESGSQEQDADYVMFLWRQSKPADATQPYPINWKLGKHRNGPIGWAKLMFQSSRLRFYDPEHDYEEF